jgi:hypothetical protein
VPAVHEPHGAAVPVSTFGGMDTTKPPLTCPPCQQPIAPGEPMDLRYPTNEKGEQIGPVEAYHQGHAR